MKRQSAYKSNKTTWEQDWLMWPVSHPGTNHAGLWRITGWTGTNIKPGFWLL